jgi:hypothetical protein
MLFSSYLTVSQFEKKAKKKENGSEKEKNNCSFRSQQLVTEDVVCGAGGPARIQCFETWSAPIAHHQLAPTGQNLRRQQTSRRSGCLLKYQWRPFLLQS